MPALHLQSLCVCVTSCAANDPMGSNVICRQTLRKQRGQWLDFLLLNSGPFL